jgi:hypothetical protein
MNSIPGCRMPILPARTGYPVRAHHADARRCRHDIRSRLLQALLLTCTVLSLGAQAAERAPAGRVLLVTGTASAADFGTMAMRPLQRDDLVYAGEIVTAGPNTYVNLKFTDDSFVLLRPNTRFVIEDYSYSAAAPEPTAEPAPVAAPGAAAAPTPPSMPAGPAPQSGPVATPAAAAVAAARPPARAFFRLLKGGFRAVSGAIGSADPAEYRVNTPVATIGIRGTDYWVVLCDAACVADPAVNDNLPPGARALGGALVGVITGGVFSINEAGQRAEIKANQFLVTLPDGSQLFLPFEPRFVRIDPIPNPATICEQ